MFRYALLLVLALQVLPDVCQAQTNVPDFAKDYPKECVYPELTSKCAAASAKAALQSDETIVGAWIDEKHPAGFVVITKTATGYSHIHAYFQGGTSRTYAKEKEPLVLTTSSVGLRTWETPVAVSKSERHMGTDVPVYFNVSGDIIDVYRFVEQAEGTLASFQYLSFEFSKAQPTPWMRGRPFKLDR